MAAGNKEVNVAAISGLSGSGKTTLIVALIGHYLAAGRSVAAIKHTHHPLNEEHRGDTAKFLAAGARPVILANDGEAVLFDPAPRRIRFSRPGELLEPLGAEIVLVEGFHRFGGWPRMEIRRERRPSLQEAVANLDRIWHPTA
jgi:molybdopterin-guanine dinucleotide biosynthesis protein B